jgi:hypothetical protein
MPVRVWPGIPIVEQQWYNISMTTRKYDPLVRDLARSLRIEKRATVGAIMNATGCPKGIVCYWLRDIPLSKQEIRVMYDGLPVRERLLKLVSIDADGCWLWTGSLTPKGYACIPWRKKGTHRAHRVSYEEFVGAIPVGLILDHTCHNPALCSGGVSCKHRRCVNPEHLEPVTIEENLRRGNGPGAGNKASIKSKLKITHCPRGHEYTPQNTAYYHTNNARSCKACSRDRTKNKRELRRIHEQPISNGSCA